jgi:hypothetical protein
MKICQVIFSTNRIEYLTKTLAAQRLLDFSGCHVDKIFIDDFPKGRDDLFITELVKVYGYKEIYLHRENLGLSVTWTEFWNLVKTRDYDYIWHQEDDVEILQPVKILDLIELLNQDQELSQIVLERQAWYPHEKDPTALDTDHIFKEYRYERESFIFSPLASLYPTSRVHVDYSSWYKKHFPDNNYHKINFNEGMVGKVLINQFNLKSGHLKDKDGKNLVNHIGEYFVGKRVLPDEPYYEKFSRYIPEQRYNSKTGENWEK